MKKIDESLKFDDVRIIAISGVKSVGAISQKNPDLIVGVIGCMAERLKDKLFEEEPIIDLIAGPDAYRQVR